MEDFVVDLKAGRQQLLARNSNLMMITQNETTGTPVKLQLRLLVYLRYVMMAPKYAPEPYTFPNKATPGPDPLHLNTCKRCGIWSKPSHASMGSPICAMSPFVHLVVPFNHPWPMNLQLTALSTHDIMCNRDAYRKRDLSISRLSVLEKIHEGTQRCSDQQLRTALGFAATNKPSCLH